MMRTIRIITLHFEQAIAYRSRALVWFLLALINPAIYLLFWTGAITSGKMTGPSITLSEVTTYYVLLIIAGALLMAHIEQEVAQTDIKEGALVRYLLKPYSYFWLKFFEELPYRVVQGSYGLLGMLVMLLFFGTYARFVTDPAGVLLAILVSVAAFFLSFIFKMVIGLLTFWLEDFSGLQQLVFIAISLFAGFIQPLEYFPQTLKNIALVTPFPYMIYFPVMAWTGSMGDEATLRIFLVQLGIIAGLVGCYTILWRKGIRTFTGVGQ